MTRVTNTDNLRLAFNFSTPLSGEITILGVEMELFWRTDKDSKWYSWKNSFNCGTAIYRPFIIIGMLFNESTIPIELKTAYYEMRNNGNPNIIREYVYKHTEWLFVDYHPDKDAICLIEKKQVKKYLNPLFSEIGITFVDINYLSDDLYSILFQSSKDYALISDFGIAPFNPDEYDKVLVDEEEMKALVNCLFMEITDEKNKRIEQALDEIFDYRKEDLFQPFSSY